MKKKEVCCRSGSFQEEKKENQSQFSLYNPEAWNSEIISPKNKLLMNFIL